MTTVKEWLNEHPAYEEAKWFDNDAYKKENAAKTAARDEKQAQAQAWVDRQETHTEYKQPPMTHNANQVYDEVNPIIRVLLTAVSFALLIGVIIWAIS
jgi:hypothetical protein